MAALLDASSKSSNSDWQNMLNMFNAIVGRFYVSATCVRVAAVRYADSAQVSFGLTQYNDRTSLQQAIRSLTLISGGSNLLSALQTLQSQVFASNIVRPSVRLVAGILTDRLSCSNGQQKQQLLAQATALKTQGVIILGIAFTARGQVDTACLGEIVTNNMYLNVPDYNQYNNYVDDAVAGVCPENFWGECSLSAKYHDANICILVYL